MPSDARDIAAHFDVRGKLVAAEPFGPGHINDSYELTYRIGATTARYLLQLINTAIFKQPAELMENIQRVTAHLAARLADQHLPDLDRRVLTLVPALSAQPDAGAPASGAPACGAPADGAPASGRLAAGTPVLPDQAGRTTWYRDEAGDYWRLYRFIEHTRTFEAPDSPARAEQAARAFGEFQRLLADLPAPRLHETIPDFHNTPLRYEALEQAIAADVCGRVADTRAEIEFARRRRAVADILLDLYRRGEIPSRSVHNDAKISNVLFDAATGQALCVVDLDTVMPGLSLYDFGDMVRSMVCTAGEDEPDLSKVEVQLPLFAALARGYLGSAGAILTPAERTHLVTAGKLITLEQGVRFLTDYLRGDTYYKIHRPHHNLARTRAQFKLVESIERHGQAMSSAAGCE